MLLYLFFLLPGCFCYGSSEIPIKTVQQNSVATLPCAHEQGDVTWTRLFTGKWVTLVTIKNGVGETLMERYGSLANSLVITNVTPFDTTTYRCNSARVYLNVTTDPNMVGGEPVTASGLGPGPENQQPPASGLWKVAVGVVVVGVVLVGVAAVLLGVVTRIFCFKNRVEKTTRLEKTETEVIYEEIGVEERRPGMDSYFESPYSFPSVSEPASSSTTPSNPNNLYSTINMLATEGRSSEQCVYSLAQSPVESE